jgi:Phage portal protein
VNLLRPKWARAVIEAAGTVQLDTRTSVRPNGWGVGISRLAPFDFAPPVDIWSRESAMSIPSVSRARDLICTAVAGLPICLYVVRFDPTQRVPVEERLPPPRWANRLDPNKPRQHTLAWLTDDLFFNSRAYLRVTSRLATTYPATFEWMPFVDVNIDATGRVTYRGKEVDPTDVVEFCSPIEGLLSVGYRAIQTALNLDAAAERFSTAEIPAGWLAQRPDSEPLSSDELAGMADDWQAARLARTTAALNPYLEWHESAMDPSRLQLIEARQHASVEMARLCNIPAYFLNAPAGTGMTYMNAAQAKQDLIDFGALPFIQCIEQTLGGPNVVPNGQAVRLDVNAWLRNPYVPNDNASPNDLEIAYNAPPAPSPPSERAPGRPRDIDGLNEGTSP